MSEVRGCPFLKIWLNGSISNSFTESYIDELPHVWGSPTIIDKNRGFNWEKQEPLFDFVWYIKATIKPKVDKRTASYMCWV